MSVFYQIRYERDGELIATFSTHADTEAEALAKADAFYSTNPEHDFRDAGVTHRVGRLEHVEGKYKVVCADGTFDA